MQLKTLLAQSVCAALLVTGASAVAQNQPNPPPTKQQPDPDRIICEKIRETGSRLNTRKVCMTAQQWEEQRRRDRENLQDAQQRSLEPNSG
jgi:invasion protein IalB